MPVFAKGVHNVVENNILICEENSECAIRSFEMANEPVRQHVYRRNIIVVRGDAAVYRFQNWSDDRVAAADCNVVHHPAGKYAVQGIPGDDTWAHWRELFDGKFDAHSVLADPMFVDEDNDDYRLKEGSPALEAGFVEIDPAGIGLLPDHPYYREAR
jgi:hypothetical protein